MFIAQFTVPFTYKIVVVIIYTCLFKLKIILVPIAFLTRISFKGGLKIILKLFAVCILSGACEVPHAGDHHLAEGRVYVEEEGLVDVPGTHLPEVGLVPAHPVRVGYLQARFGLR